MPLTSTGDLIASDRTTPTARLVPGRPHAGHVTRRPGRHLNRSSAVTAITLATRPPETTSGREPAVSPAGREAVGP